MDNEIRLIKKEQEQVNTPKESPTFRRKDSVITANSPIIKRLKEAEERNRNRKELSDDELIEIEFKEEADRIRAQKLQDSKRPSDIVIKTTKIKNDDFNLDYIKDDNDILSYRNFYESSAKKEQDSAPIIELHKTEPTREPIAREPLNRNTESTLQSTETRLSNHTAKQNLNDVDIKQNPPQTLAERLRLAKMNANKLTQTMNSQEQIIIKENINNNKSINTDKKELQDSNQLDNNQYIQSTQDSYNKQNDFIVDSVEIIKESLQDGEFVLPPTDLLDKPRLQRIDIDDGEADLKANNLINKLRVFKINGDIADIYSGPVVTTFEFRPAYDVKVSRIQGLQDDLSMALKAKSIRIQAPIPGKDVVGIEIPNNTIQTIYIREIFESDEFVHSNASLAIVLGKDIIGRPVVQDLAKLPHLLIAGTTGSGKSVGLNGMILSLLYKKTPKDLRFIMIDPKRVELSLYKDIPHLLTPIITDSKKAVIALSKAVDEMNRRYEVMNEAGVKNIIGYNEIAKQQDLEQLPYIVIIIDEFADLMIMGGKDAEQYLISLASKARASGIHLIIATQRPTVNVVTGLIKSNLPSKISYRVGSQMDSKVILDKTGAESLLGNGDMLFSNTNSITRFHAPYSNEKEIERVADFIRNQQKVEYDEFFSLEPKEATQQTLMNTMPTTEEEYINKAKEIITSTQKTSISYLQRALGIGFNKAANIIESLEKEGFLSPPNSKGIREIIS
ncbi:hypothetical protein CCY99_03340 [Helicobacter sp. 16-1353]|uniref:DNA translocase FtsK n=1 Tax=Helicobacter sp. 16-1353 TaxID=2004996 RepID=UPI000DCE454B|nr:DNA translocase FtsK [Helicobacter sp. 16-1353]RAX54400.1 hypothetical protein CCY99_03340 [Helicobacter sp. 16-1353]